MSESKFTPGPWVVEQSEKTPIYVSPVGRHENISICNVLTIDDDDSESGDWINGDQTKANARLIAAAPDMHKTLCLLRDTLPHVAMDSASRGEMLRRINQVLATASPMGKE